LLFANRLPGLLRGFSNRRRELDHLPAQIGGNPLHLAFVAIRNVKLYHLCHSHPPIQRDDSLAVTVTRAEAVAFTCLDAEKVAGGDLIEGST